MKFLLDYFISPRLLKFNRYQIVHSEILGFISLSEMDSARKIKIAHCAILKIQLQVDRLEILEALKTQYLLKNF